MNAKQYFEDYLPGPKRTVFHTKKGLSWRNAWGVLRYSANNAFLALVHSAQMKELVSRSCSFQQFECVTINTRWDGRTCPQLLSSKAQVDIPLCSAERVGSCVQGDEAYAATLFTYAAQQINYALGDAGRSFVVGFGKNAPKTPFHKW